MKEPEYSAMSPAVAAAIAEMRAEQGDKFSLEKINLAELERRTGISRAKLRRLKENGFVEKTHASKGRKASSTLLSGYTGILDGLLKNGIMVPQFQTTARKNIVNMVKYNQKVKRRFHHDTKNLHTGV